MPRTLEKTVYQFVELSDDAKDRARQWLRDAQSQDSDWYDSVYQDAESMGSLIGISINQRLFQTVGGKTRYEPAIYFSGFCSQGDGACFEGSYAYTRGASEHVRIEAPLDAVLHSIADRLQAIQAPHFYRLTANVAHRGHYYHELCTDIDVANGRGIDVPDAVAEGVTEALRDFMRWIYRQLETEDTYRNSDEQIDEFLRANEYEFDDAGNIA